MGSRWHRLVLGILGGVLCLAVVSACGDDGGGGDAAATTEVASGTTASSTSSTSATDGDDTDDATDGEESPDPGTDDDGTADDDTDDGTTPTVGDDDHDPPAPPDPVVDVVAGTVAGHLLGAPAGAVLDSLSASLGPPTTDTGWQSTECPPADHVRTVIWGGLFVHFGHLGEETLDGVRLDAALDPTAEHLAVLPPGVAWGDDIDAVAAAIGTPAIVDEAFGWSEVLTEAFPAPLRLLAGDGVGGQFDHLMMGFVPICR